MKTKHKRVELVGVVNVFRNGSHRESLSATFKSGSIYFYYDKCPKSFNDLIVDGTRNCVKVKMMVNEDGSNPRCVVKIADPY